MGNQGVDDMISLTKLNEEAILENLKLRYAKNTIYTYTGSILVSVNPYQQLPIYETDTVQRYRGVRMGVLPPHIFATADAAYGNMREHKENQSVIISGESGAGKSESTKLILQYLAAMTSNHSWVEQQILEAGVVLEAFGNAKTVRNNNSSRFGKFVEIHFDDSGHIVGAKIIQYLLEKSRIVNQAPSERNYHIFYEMLAGVSEEERGALKLLPPEKYHYLNQSGCISLDKVDDGELFGNVRIAMTVLGISNETQDSIFRVLSAVLLLGNIEFKSDGKEGCAIKSTEELSSVAALLNVDGAALSNALTVRSMKVRGQNLTIPLKPEQAVDTRDALAKGLYGRLFIWLVDSINLSIDIGKHSNFIGVLDIFGFENFAVNSFEQLCINYTNEKLQQYFNQHIFKLEQEEYTKERIPWDSIQFVDNQECLDLIEKKPICILSMLDEECKFPNGSDASLLEKLHQKLEKHKYYVRNKRSRTAFGILHYAGEVQYESPSFLDKNRDTLYEELVSLIQGSSSQFIASLFPQDLAVSKRTVSTQFKDELNNLMKTLSETSPHYVRCVKPNPQKQPGLFDDKLVTDQLRFSGMLDTIRIRQAGFPIRFSFETFHQRYRVIKPETMKLPLSSARASCELVLKEFNPDLWRLGVTKVFMKEKLEGPLGDRRNARLHEVVTKLQRLYRTYKAHQHFKRLRTSALTFQTVIRGYHARISHEKSCEASSVLGAALLSTSQMRVFAATKRGIIAMQLAIRKYYAIKKRNYLLQAIIKIQATFRMFVCRKRYNEKRAAVILIEAAVRGLLARKNTMPELDKRMKLLAEDESRMPPEEQARRQKLREEEAKKVAALEAQLRAEEELKRQAEEAAKKEKDETERTEREERLRIEKEKRLREMKELEELESDLRSQQLSPPAESAAVVESALSVEDFEDTLAELQSFIDGDVFTTLGEPNSSAAPASIKPERELKLELAPQAADLDNYTEADIEAQNTPLVTPDAAQDCLENYDLPEEEEEDRPPPLNVYLNYTTFKLESFAMNHFTPPPKKIKKDTWTKILSFSKKNLAQPLLQQVAKDSNLSHESLNISFDMEAIMKYQGEISQRKLLRKQTTKELAEYVVGTGIEIPELRDEIFCQLCKQTNNNPKSDAAIRGWELMALVCSSFAPSKALIKYVCNYIQSSIPRDGDEGRFATFCLKRLSRTLLMGERRLPPSDTELEAVKARRSIITRVHLMDEKAKALDLDASTSTKEIFNSIVEKINLTQTAGFALFEQFDSMERSLKPHELLGDLLFKWEKNSRGAGQCKIVFKKKIFLPTLPDPIDPVAKDLIFWQATNDVLQSKLPCDEKDAIKLAAYQLQSVWGDYEQSKDIIKSLSTEITKYIPKHLVASASPEEWAKRIAPVQQELKGIDSLIARDMYVKFVKKWPLYGSVIFPVKSSGELEKRNISVAVNWNGMHVLDRTTRQVLQSYDHNQIILASYTPSRFNFTVEQPDGSKKLLVFGTPMGVEIDPLIRIYNSFYRKNFKKTKKDPARELAKKKEAEEAERRTDAWATNTEDIELPPPVDAEKYPIKEYAAQFFVLNANATFQREPQQVALHNTDISKDAAIISALIVAYMKNTTPDNRRKLTATESVDIVKSLLDNAIKKQKIRNELFCQLIKQTTQNPHADMLARAWHLMAVCAGTFLPTKDLIPYLRAYLQTTAHQQVEKDLRMYASLAQIRLQRTVVFGGRKEVPSALELSATLARKPIILRVTTLDNKAKALGVDGTTTAKDLAAKVARKLNLRDFRGFSVFCVVDDCWDEERSLLDNELIGEVLQQFEELEKKGHKSCQLYFKRKIFYNPTEEPSDPILKDMLFFQALHDVTHDKFPLMSERDAVKMASFQMQILWGDHDPTKDIVKQQLSANLSKYVPRRLISKMKPEQWQQEINTFYTALNGRSAEEAKDIYMKFIRKWPLYGASVFNVKQTSKPNLPKDLWLLVALDGVHLLKPGEEAAVLSMTFDSIAHYGGNPTSFFMVSGSLMNSQKHVFTTKQGAEIANVLNIYMAESKNVLKK